MDEGPEWDSGDVVYAIDALKKRLDLNDSWKVGLLMVIAICEVLSLVHGVK